MTVNRICLDGFSGAILAIESFSDGSAVLHGPGGCRNYHTFLSSQCYPRAKPGDFRKYSKQYFFGQARIPCTYLDEDNYINGSNKKLEECIPLICDSDDCFHVFIKSPGAALIGDNITDVITRCGFGERAMAIEESLISQPFSSSYDHTVKSVLEWAAPVKMETVHGTVNILGLPISSNDWEDALSELVSLLEDMGLKVISTPGAGCSLSKLKESTSAEYNICVSPEYCIRTAKYYEDAYGIPTIFSDMGAPVGFDATEYWLENIGKIIGTDTIKVKERIHTLKERAFRRISGSMYSQRVKCSRFTIMADSSVTYPLMRWLYSYLCMIPVSISVDPGEDKKMTNAIMEFLDDAGLKESWNADPANKVDFIFTDGHTAETQAMMGKCKKGVDISMPNLSRANFIPRPIYGLNGSMFILDEVFNGL